MMQRRPKFGNEGVMVDKGAPFLRYITFHTFHTFHTLRTVRLFGASNVRNLSFCHSS